MGLNPYSTGSNSNTYEYALPLIVERLNPYSTGSNSNYLSFLVQVLMWSLNPYSTGSNSNITGAPEGGIDQTKVLILILLEVTQIITLGDNPTVMCVLILILLEVTQIIKCS